MCHELDALRQSIAGYATGFDARALTPAQAGQMVVVCARIEASVASLKALVAARAAVGHGWQRDGFRSPADQLAHQAGMSPGAAKRAFDTGRRLAEQPEVAKAALAGDLSAEQANAVSEGVAANPAKAKDLIDKAKHSSVPELNEEVARTKAAATDGEARRRAIHARRSLRRWTDRDGAFQAHLYGHPEDGAGLWRMLDPIRRRLNLLRRGTMPNEAFEALDYDAIMAMAAIASGHDGELSLADLLDLGLFPQLDSDTIVARPSPPPATTAKTTPETAPKDAAAPGLHPRPNLGQRRPRWPGPANSACSQLRTTSSYPKAGPTHPSLAPMPSTRLGRLRSPTGHPDRRPTHPSRPPGWAAQEVGR